MSNRPDSSVPNRAALPSEAIPRSHPAYPAHRAAIRSIERVVDDLAPSQDARVASTGIAQLLRLRPLVLTGAGISTDSGIPDYRGPQGSLRHHRPMTYQEFIHDDAARHRYWARSFVGWRHLDQAQPNAGHRVLAEWNTTGVISGIITQNVDGLHEQAQRAVGQAVQGAAGGSGSHAPDLTAQSDHSDLDLDTSAPVIPLHGTMDEIECLVCGNTEARAAFDVRLTDANPGFIAAVDAQDARINPDGDAELADGWVDKFTMVGCLNCGSVKLKPTVVYFGEAVPVPRKEQVDRLLAESGALIIVGSSVAVMSGFRLVLDAQKQRKPVAIINAGPSRADDRATFRWRTTAAEALQWLEANRLKTAGGERFR